MEITKPLIPWFLKGDRMRLLRALVHPVPPNIPYYRPNVAG